MSNKKVILLSLLFLIFFFSPKGVQARYDPGGGGSAGGEDVSNVIGKITPPPPFNNNGYGPVGGGLGKFLNNIFMLLTVGAGIFALFNFIMAGYTYMGAKNDKEKIANAGAMIVNSLIGLLIIASAFVIAALAGQIFFGDWQFILNPKIYGPDTPASQINISQIFT